MKYTLKELEEKAKQPGKPADFLAVALAHCRTVEGEPDTYEISPEEMRTLYLKRPDMFTQTRKGLGDAVSAIATPIAKALGMDCVNKETGQLRPESKCAKRKAALNAVIPPKLEP